MAVLRSPRAPGRGRGAGDVLELVERVLYVRLERVAGKDVRAVVDVQARVERDDRLHVQVLRPLEKLEQAEPVGRPVAPRAHVRRALLDGPIVSFQLKRFSKFGPSR